MDKIKCEIDIEAPIDYVFQWGTDPKNLFRCMPSVIDIEILDETEEYLKVRKTLKVLGQTLTCEELYQIDEENKLTTPIFHDGDVCGELVFDYSETENGTKVRVDGNIEFDTSEFNRDIRPVAPSHMIRQFENTFKTMKELIEAEYSERDWVTGPNPLIAGG